MRRISKSREPASLTEHRCAPGANYAGYRDKETLRSYLVQEQRGLCCYCLSRIRPERDQMKVEHWHCQSTYHAEQLDYSNMLATCMGNQRQPFRSQHCDMRKGDQDLSRNPANPQHRVDEFIRFDGDGRVFSSDPVFDVEINHVLNLNLAFLRNNRKATLDAFLAALVKVGEISSGRCASWLQDWDGQSGAGDLKPFCQVVVYWLRKRLARA
jgi:uncharacterized protein (TIGR02646 family)